MLGTQLVTQRCIPEIMNFGFNISEVVGKFKAQLAADFHSLLIIFNGINSAENNNTADIQRPFALLFIARIINAKGNLVIECQCIDLMSLFTAVKINTAVFLIIPIVYRQTVGITAVTVDR